MKEITAGQIKHIKERGLHRVGGVSGLYLQVAKGGSRSWILRATVGEKRRDIGLGGYPDVSLGSAREKARQARDLIKQGIDPVADREKARRSLIESQRSPTFADAALKCHAKKEPEFRNAKHGQDWLRSLEMYAFPIFGEKKVADIDKEDVLAALEPIWLEKTETATRVRQRIESVLSWATVLGYRTKDNVAKWRGNLEELLADPKKVKKTTHYAALPYKQVPRFMAELKRRQGASAAALEFAILTAARSGEVRGMTWDEVNLKKAVWEIPKERMKADRRHRVPLSKPALAILESAPRLKDCPFVFPAPRGGQLSDMALLSVVRKMNVDAVPHGFRSSFKDWCRTKAKKFPDEVSELALAHVNSDQTRAAYARDELLPLRRKLMEKWAKYLNPKTAEVIPLKRASND